MERHKEVRLATLLEVHQEIAEDIANEKQMGQSEVHITGEQEALNRVEGMIHELAEE